MYGYGYLDYHNMHLPLKNTAKINFNYLTVKIYLGQ